jgi:hypothetical protein
MRISPSGGSERVAGKAAQQAAELAAELYLVPPVRFVATRDLVARQASQGGRPELAALLRELRRPTHSAWLVNLLVREEQAGMGELRALGRQLREAQTALDGDELRRLSERRRVLVGELTELARQQAAAAGVAVAERTLTEVEATLTAALVDLAASCAVMSGRLIRPMSHNGFGPRPRLDDEPVRVRPAGPLPGDDDWLFWPATPDIDAEVAVDEAEWYEEEDDQPVRRRHLSLVPALEPEPAPALAPAELAALRAAEEAARQARDEVTWFDQHRMVARSEQVAAENRLREAQRKLEEKKAVQAPLFELDQD